MLNKLAGLLLLLVTLGASAHADSVYQITGSLTIPGNSANPQVSETIYFTVDLDYAAPGITASLVGTPVITASGPLGEFAVVYVPGSSIEIGFGSPDAVLELDSQFFLGQSAINPTYSDVWGCFDPTICAEFMPIRSFNGPTVGNALLWPGTANISVSNVPEPATMSLCVLGILALFLRKNTLTRSN